MHSDILKAPSFFGRFLYARFAGAHDRDGINVWDSYAKSGNWKLENLKLKGCRSHPRKVTSHTAPETVASSSVAHYFAF